LTEVVYLHRLPRGAKRLAVLGHDGWRLKLYTRDGAFYAKFTPEAGSSYELILELRDQRVEEAVRLALREVLVG